MKYEEIEPYLIDFIKGQADEATEYRIKAYLQQNPDFQEELDELQTTLEYTQELPLATPPPSMKLDFYAMLKQAKATQEKQAPKVNWWTNLQNDWLRGFAVASVVVLVFFTGYWSSTWLQPDFATETQKEVSLQTTPKENNTLEELNEESADEESITEEETLEQPSDNEKQAEGLRESTQNTALATENTNLIAQKKEKLGIVKDNTKEDMQVREEQDFSEVWIQADTQRTQKEKDVYSERVGSPTLSNSNYQDTSEIARENLGNSNRKNTNSRSKKMSKQSSAHIIEDFKNGSSLSVRLASLKQLEVNVLEDKTIQDVLFEQLKKEQDTEVQLAILNVIEAKKLKRAKKTLKTLLKDSETNANLKQRIQNVLKGL